MKLVDVADAQQNLTAVLDSAKTERVMVAHGEHPVGVILSVADYQDWTGTSDEELSLLFASAEVQEKLARADGDYAAGRTVSHEDVDRMLSAREHGDG